MSDESVLGGSSFDRYLANRAPTLLWSTPAARASVINTNVGYGLLGLSALLTGIGLIFVGIQGFAMGIGPAIGGVINVLVGRAWRTRAKRTAGDTQIPDPVWTFLHGLTMHVLGPAYPFRTSYLGHYPVSNSWSGWRPTPRVSASAVSAPANRSAREMLDPRVFDLLEAAAKQFNRVQGHVHTSEAGGAKPSEAPRIQVAADQAMIDALSIAATMQQFPENIESLRPSLEACTTALNEAADLVATISTSTAQAAQPKEQATMLRGMIEDLRIEALARTELSEAPAETTQRRNVAG